MYIYLYIYAGVHLYKHIHIYIMEREAAARHQGRSKHMGKKIGDLHQSSPVPPHFLHSL